MHDFKFKHHGPLFLFKNIILVPKQTVFKKLNYFLLFMIFYSWMIWLFNSKLNFLGEDNNLGQFHLLFSFCLSILIGLRINIAYDRWWEGRGHLGSLVNNSRNLYMKIHSYVDESDNKELLLLVKNFPHILKLHLKNKHGELINLSIELGFKNTDQLHIPNLVLFHITNKINVLLQKKAISSEQFLVLQQNIDNLVDVLGACEKINNTTPPIGFSLLTRFSLAFYMLIFPFGWISIFGFFSMPIIIIFIYILTGLELLAEELDEPFGDDDVDLPVDLIANNITKNIEQISKF